MKSLGNGLLAVGAVLVLVALMWLVTNMVAGVLEPGGFILGLFFMLLLGLPVIVAGIYLRGRGAEESEAATVFDERRRLFEQDKMFRQTLSKLARDAARSMDSGVAGATGDAVTSGTEARRVLENLAGDAAAPISEADWLHATELGPEDARQISQYDDLLLAALRRIRDEAGSRIPASSESGSGLVELARSAARQFALRQDLVLRGRRLPSVSPLHLVKGTVPRGETDAAPESLKPGAAVSRQESNYLVTAHISYFGEGRNWYALVLRGEEGERRLVAEPGDTQGVFLAPAEKGTAMTTVEESGSASVSIESLSGSADGLVVEYRRGSAGDGGVVWWERWTDGEKSFLGERVDLDEFEFWPVAVGSEPAV